MVMAQPDVQVGMDTLKVGVKGQKVEGDQQEREPLSTNADDVCCIALWRNNNIIDVIHVASFPTVPFQSGSAYSH